MRRLNTILYSQYAQVLSQIDLVGNDSGCQGINLLDSRHTVVYPSNWPKRRGAFAVRQALKTALRTSPLLDTPRFVRNIELVPRRMAKVPPGADNRRKALREKLAHLKNGSALFGTHGFAAHLEAAFEKMMEFFNNRLTPRSFSIESKLTEIECPAW